ncbi:MAG: SGNH/GDSL hydrolase family protein [Planctomycetota bacterium]
MAGVEAAMKRVFVLGDSISIGFGPFLEQALRGSMQYDRKSGLHEALQNLDLPQGANGGDSNACLAYLRGWKDQGGIPADILVLNCGLHDLKHLRDTRQHQVPIETYRDNLLKIIRVVKNMNLKLIWVRTTPVNEIWHQEKKDFDRWEADVDGYNAAADAIMKLSSVPICDLFTFTRNIPEAMSPDGVHFNERAQQLQGVFIAGYLSSYVDASTTTTESTAV